MQLLDEILELTNSMRFQAVGSDWDAVRESEVQRRGLISACFPLSDPASSEVERAVEQIKQIMELDRSIMAMAAIAREELGSEFGRLKQGRQAARAYQQAGR